MFRRVKNHSGMEWALYEIQGLDRPVQVKFKIIDRNVLVVKMRCGAYIKADRVGHYFNELCLGSKYGFDINARAIGV